MHMPLPLQIEEAQWSLTEKERLVSKLHEQEKALHTSFSEALGENNKFKDFLTKVSAGSCPG